MDELVRKFVGEWLAQARRVLGDKVASWLFDFDCFLVFVDLGFRRFYKTFFSDAGSARSQQFFTFSLYKTPRQIPSQNPFLLCAGCEIGTEGASYWVHLSPQGPQGECDRCQEIVLRHSAFPIDLQNYSARLRLG